MKQLIQEYLKLIAYAITGIIFAYASFYLIMNMYHQKELNRKTTIDLETNSTYMSIQEKKSIISENINSVEGKISSNQLLNIQGRLQICIKQYDNETITKLSKKKEFGFTEIDQLVASYQNDILSSCFVEQLYDLAVADQTDRFQIESLKQIAPYLETNIKNLLASTNYLRSDISNNYIYYFTTEHTYQAQFNKIGLGLSEILSSYDRSIDLLLEVSEWFKQEVGE